MPKLSQTVTTTTTKVVKLTPALKKKLLVELKTYTSLRDQKKALELAMKKHSGTVEEIMETAGEASLEVDGFKTTLIAPVKKKLDPKRLVTLGVSTETIAKATTETPGTPYVKISKAGEKSEDGDE